MLEIDDRIFLQKDTLLLQPRTFQLVKTVCCIHTWLHLLLERVYIYIWQDTWMDMTIFVYKFTSGTSVILHLYFGGTLENAQRGNVKQNAINVSLHLSVQMP